VWFGQPVPADLGAAGGQRLKEQRCAGPLVAVERYAEHGSQLCDGKLEHRREFAFDVDGVRPPRPVQVIAPGESLGDHQSRVVPRGHAASLSAVRVRAWVNGMA
jgi:hypothetical protein